MITFDRHILSPAFTPNLTYKDSDLLNVMLVGRAPLAAACPPDRPYKTFADVMSDAKQRPGKPSIGLLSASGALLLAVYLQKSNGFELNQIYYKGGGPTVQDLLAGVTDMSITTLGALRPHFSSGKLKPLATTGDKRVPSLPDVPTLGELGLKTYPTYSWWGVYAPAGAPAPIVERIGRVRCLPEGRAGPLVQGDQRQRHQGRLSATVKSTITRVIVLKCKRACISTPLCQVSPTPCHDERGQI